jgi:hypothetical protein
MDAMPGKPQKLPKVAKVKNKAPNEVQITAEQLLREAKERDLEIVAPVRDKVAQIRFLSYESFNVLFFFFVASSSHRAKRSLMRPSWLTTVFGSGRTSRTRFGETESTFPTGCSMPRGKRARKSFRG